jgi:hypothetical protein
MNNLEVSYARLHVHDSLLVIQCTGRKVMQNS